MIGKTISHYKILEKLGEGGMGEVYRAEDINLKREVALKFLPKEFSSDPDAKKRFMSEARSASILDHNNICVIHEISETEDGQLFISMNYCTGETLQRKMQEEQLDLKDVLKYIAQIAKGLEKAHSHEIIHCDIKPGNIIVTDDGIAKIVDFGIAKIASEEKLHSKERTSGTIAYMSPEQVGSSGIDPRTDIWSLGVIFYEMLTKRTPFQDSYNEALMYSIINEEPYAITKINPDIPAEIEQIVNKLIQKNPDDRYQKISDLLLDLKNYKRNINIPAFPLQILNNIYNWKNKNRFYLLYIALSIVAIAFITFFAMTHTPYVPSIGILNMENLGDPEDEFWSRGITEDLIINVASAGVIRVPTINDVNKYKLSEFSMTEIAEKLRVDYLLSSSFFKTDSVFDLWCRIIDPKSGKDIFAKKWTKPVNSTSSIITILAGSVLNNLGISSKKSQIISVVVDPDAYELYLKGKQAWEIRQNNNDINLARGLLEQALFIYPNFMQAKIQLGQTYTGTADYKRAIEIFNECLDYANKIDDENIATSAILNIGNVHYYRYQIDVAIENYEKALKLARKHNDKYSEGKLLRNMGSSHYMLSNYDQAEKYYIKSQILSAELEDEQGKGEALNNLGSVYIEKEDYIRAMNFYKNSYDIFSKIDNKSQMVNSLIGLSYSSMGLGKIESALNYADASLQAAIEISDKRNEISSSSYIGEINYKIGNYDSALDIFLNVSKLSENIGETYYLGVSYQYIGQLMSQKELYEESFKFFQLANNVWNKLDDLTYGIWTTSAWALASLKFGDNLTATNKLLESERILNSTKPYEDYAVCVYYDLYKYHMVVRDTSRALHYLKNANDEINDRLKFINSSKEKYAYLNRIVKYNEIVDLYEQYFD